MRPVLHNHDSYTLFLPLILAGFILFPFSAVAQTGSSDGTAGSSSSTVPETTATSAAAAIPASRGAGAQVSVPTTPTPRPTPATTNSTPTAASSSAQDIPLTKDASNNFILWVALAALAILPFGYLVAQSLKNKKTKEEKKDTDGCFNIKKLLDDKLKELTDLKGKLESNLKNKAKETMREAVRGTSVGDTLALIEKAEKEYGRLKKLYEECTIEFEKSMFKGTIVENSLSNKDILTKVKIERTYHSGDWKLHDVFIDEKQIPELSKYLAHGPWYIHLWKQGKDDVRVVFKEKAFTIKFSDKSTWQGAIAYGKSIGIPEEQLDFTIH